MSMIKAPETVTKPRAIGPNMVHIIFTFGLLLTAECPFIAWQVYPHLAQDMF